MNRKKGLQTPANLAVGAIDESNQSGAIFGLTDQIGSADTLNGIRHAAFMPYDRIGGSNGAGGRLTVDSGVFNSQLMAGKPGENDRIGGSNGAGGRLTVDSGVFNSQLMAGKPGEKQWATERLISRFDAVITHEYEEAAHGGSHVAALEGGPDNKLPIREGARKLLRSLRGRWTTT